MDDRKQLVTDSCSTNRYSTNSSNSYSANNCGTNNHSENSPLAVPSADPALVDRLQQNIRRLETAARQGDGETVSTGSSLIDGLLPAQGLPRGTLIEWFSQTHGCGSEMFSLLAAREATVTGGALVIIDPRRTFYPPAAAAWGIDLDNTIVLRETNEQSLLWAIDQCLRSVAVAAVWGNLDAVDERWLRRFQLSAEDTGTLGLFTRPQSLRQLPSWAEIQWLVEPQSLPGLDIAPGKEQQLDAANSSLNKSQRHFRLHLMRCRGGLNGKSIDLRLDIQTGHITRQRPARISQPRLDNTLHNNLNKPDVLKRQTAHPTASTGSY